MTPGSFPLALYRGDTYRWRFVLWADSSKTQAVDLAGVLPRAEIRDKPGGTMRAAIECTVELPNVILAFLPEAASKMVRAGSWDLQLTYPSGDVATILAGAVQVTEDVTDSAPIAAPTNAPIGWGKQK